MTDIKVTVKYLARGKTDDMDVSYFPGLGKAEGFVSESVGKSQYPDGIIRRVGNEANKKICAVCRKRV